MIIYFTAPSHCKYHAEIKYLLRSINNKIVGKDVNITPVIIWDKAASNPDIEARDTITGLALPVLVKTKKKIIPNQVI